MTEWQKIRTYILPIGIIWTAGSAFMVLLWVLTRLFGPWAALAIIPVGGVLALSSIAIGDRIERRRK